MSLVSLSVEVNISDHTIDFKPANYEILIKAALLAAQAIGKFKFSLGPIQVGDPQRQGIRLISSAENTISFLVLPFGLDNGNCWPMISNVPPQPCGYAVFMERVRCVLQVNASALSSTREKQLIALCKLFNGQPIHPLVLGRKHARAVGLKNLSQMNELLLVATSNGFALYPSFESGTYIWQNDFLQKNLPQSKTNGVKPQLPQLAAVPLPALPVESSQPVLGATEELLAPKEQVTQPSETKKTLTEYEALVYLFYRTKGKQLLPKQPPTWYGETTLKGQFDYQELIRLGIASNFLSKTWDSQQKRQIVKWTRIFFDAVEVLLFVDRSGASPLDENVREMLDLLCENPSGCALDDNLPMTAEEIINFLRQATSAGRLNFGGPDKKRYWFLPEAQEFLAKKAELAKQTEVAVPRTNLALRQEYNRQLTELHANIVSAQEKCDKHEQLWHEAQRKLDELRVAEKALREKLDGVLLEIVSTIPKDVLEFLRHHPELIS